ncbi:MAG: SpoVK/Ycf46/Vps4 family AAA+-type ATPase [Cellvibrionaceae bacterium]|jgi:SpoVK/Ycf46/Vps4 family AAA+-type ATPase
MEELHDIELMVKKGISLIAIESFEEPRVLELCTRLALKTFRKLYRWTSTDGLVDNASTHQVSEPKYDKPEELLVAIREGQHSAIYVLCDFHSYLDKPKVIRYLKDIVLYGADGITVILTGHEVKLPSEVYRHSSRFRLNFPSEDKIRQIILGEAREWQKNNNGRQVKTDSKTLDRMIGNLRGLTESDVKHLVQGAIYVDGAITSSDIADVNKSKFELMNMNNILTYEYDTAQFADVGGLKGLKTWLAERKGSFIAPQKNLDSPKGVMLLGVQGGGKSLAAKAVAGLWHVPLLRLDMAALYNKYHGETERNLRETLALADKVAPCVLWMDEIEKSLGHSDNEGLSQRVLGTLLTWMAERKSQVFIVATSNDISRLPPELVRKGRLDEIFFIDLPNQQDRESIVAIHLDKREVKIDKQSMQQIAELSEGFTGAEIEQAIVSALYSAQASQEKIAAVHIITAVTSTVPISVTRAEDITALRLWAKERAVAAN